MNARQTHALTSIDDLVADLNRIVATTGGATSSDVAFERLARWKSRAVRVLESAVHPSEARRLSTKSTGGIRIGDPWGNFNRAAEICRGFLLGLREEVTEHPESVFVTTGPLGAPGPGQAEVMAHTESEPSTLPAPPASSSSVFIVHGHDELNLHRLKELLRDRWNLVPLILSAAPGQGRTLIEKFEDEARRAAFAFVLLTPDDVVSGPGAEYAQARPNVVFELGWFYGRLGRSRVCILFKRGTFIHSDLAGVSRIEFDASVHEKLADIERELQSAGVLTSRGIAS